MSLSIGTDVFFTLHILNLGFRTLKEGGGTEVGGKGDGQFLSKDIFRYRYFSLI